MSVRGILILAVWKRPPDPVGHDDGPGSEPPGPSKMPPS